ncbi:cucumisin-like protein [Cinnamomum micranthum f. kanehirae]|uniref:Cucumisin-like protein n=1 Tax=Cinnamomum micranthum f. kanehirae TaxID=337451 RepID=A0A3S3MZL2_9MAGN|nr:cucumisin-like protein [Cinnamomum micranthum f. kanehirae]
MASTWFLPLLFAALVLNCYGQEKKIHIVYMGDLPKAGPSTASLHHTMLEDVLGSYYCIGLTERAGVVSVLPNKLFNLHTTRSWDFTGLPQTHLVSPHEGDVIVGLLDTGIWPEAASFADEGFGPPPAKWKGTCQTADNVTCNNKLIGARFYNSDNSYDVSDFKSARDSEGHGTHTSSTAAGRAVEGASFFGLAEGVARSAVPQARIAMYKVCWAYGCASADILAAFDDAIADGVDIISVSLGSGFPAQYFEDGNAINPFELNGTSLPLIYGGAAPNVSAGVMEADGLGTIMFDSAYSDFAFSYPLPATLLNIEDGNKAVNYAQAADNPIGTILAGETWKDVAAPRIVSFSSRGPNPITADILKHLLPSVMKIPGGSTFVMDGRKNEDAEFAYGSGHINPSAALHPGLVYDASEKDYVDFLCKQGYNTTTLRLVTGDSSTCDGISPGTAWDLNYPSFALSIQDGLPISGTFQRTVTNVGLSNSTYYANVLYALFSQGHRGAFHTIIFITW